MPMTGFQLGGLYTPSDYPYSQTKIYLTRCVGGGIKISVYICVYESIKKGRLFDGHTYPPSKGKSWLSQPIDARCLFDP